MFDSLRPHELQHARLPCPSQTPGVHSNSRPLSWWCHPAISSSVVPFSSCPQSLPASVFSKEPTLRIRWPKYWSFGFSISPSNEHSGLISFGMDWLEPGSLQFMGSQRVRQSWACKHAHTCTHNTHLCTLPHIYTLSNKKKILSFATIWTDLESNILWEIIHR